MHCCSRVKRVVINSFPGHAALYPGRYWASVGLRNKIEPIQALNAFFISAPGTEFGAN